MFNIFFFLYYEVCFALVSETHIFAHTTTPRFIGLFSSVIFSFSFWFINLKYFLPIFMTNEERIKFEAYNGDGPDVHGYSPRRQKAIRETIEHSRKPEEARFYSREDIGKLLELFCFRFSGSLEFFKFFPPLDNFNELKAVDSLFPENSRQVREISC